MPDSINQYRIRIHSYLNIAYKIRRFDASYFDSESPNQKRVVITISVGVDPTTFRLTAGCYYH